MELGAVEGNQGQVQNQVDIAIHKKALEQEEKAALQLLESIPPAGNLPGVGGGVDVSA